MVEVQAPKSPPRELISFHIATQNFCIDIVTVREIRGWTTATPLPHAPAGSRGVLNLRGVILPIIDLGAQLGLSPAEPTQQNVIIVAQAHDQTVGLLVDGVNGILTVTADMVQPVPQIGFGFESKQLDGLIQVDNRLQTLLNLSALLPATKAAA